MRNLKKLFAVILTVAMLASLMVPALAANTYEDEALKLQSIGMFAGEPADLKLEEGVTRIQGLAFAIRAAGKEADAFAMDDEEVATILADWTDADSIPAWGLKYAAYAIKNSITVGLSATEKIFGGLNPISGTSFLVFLMKSGMGYADVTTADVIEASVEAGILTAGQAATFGAKDALIRDDAAGILYGAAKNGVNADGTPLIEALIASGFVDEDAALAAGFVEEVVPDALEVVSVTTDNLKQLVVKFNQPIKEAGDEDNYELETVEDDGLAVIDGDSGFDLLDDEMTVVLTLTEAADQQELVNLTIKDIEAVSGADFEEVTIEEIELFDNTIPKAVSASVVGKYAVKVIFSEPIETDEDDLEDLFEVEDGDYIIDRVEKLKSDKELNVYLYSALEDGTISIECLNGIKDYAGYGIAKKTFEVEVVEDEEAPEVVGYKDAKPGSIVLIFNEDIIVTDDAEADYDEYFYHTNSNNPVSAVPVADGNELKLTFATGYELPEGTARIVIEKEALQDLWENESAKISLAVEVTLDTTKPTLNKVKQGDYEDIAELTFSEELDVDTATDTDNYTLLDKDGKVIKDAIIGASLGGDDSEVVTLTFDEDLSGNYSIVVEKVEDLAGNAISKTTVSFEMKDTTAPEDDDVIAKLYDAGKGIQLLKVSFGEVMAVTGAYSILDLDKYKVEGTILGDVDDVTIKAVDNNKAVEIRVPEEEFEIFAEDKLVIARYADEAGNKLEKFATKDIEIDGALVVEVDTVELTAEDTIVVKLKDKLTTFKAADFTITTTDAIAYSRVRHTIDADDNVSVITFTLKEAYGTAIVGTLNLVTADTTSKNVYGEELAVGTFPVTDAAAPVVVKDGITLVNGTTITIEFSEDIDSATYLPNAFNGFSVSGGKAELTKAEVTGNIVTLKGADFTRNTDISYNKVFGLADGAENKVDSFTHTDALK